ncbi:MAG: sulfite exporter TauE/SafE family protein [Cyanobacteria bacterium]|nr:sulfite exporter TauE/SafE family protein [Cyanobacteriota bacterium]
MEGTLILSTAFGLGAAHALEPGHGKTLVAAYLTGTKGKILDAFILGILVTIFHTLSVFVLVLLGIYLANLFVQFNNTIFQSLDVISGLIILGIGLMLFWRRFVVDKSQAECECHIRHVHHEGHVEVKQKASSLKDLVSLGLASGITPCPLTLSILITSVNSGRYSLPEALACLVLFSLGLASVLVVIGVSLILSEGKISKLLVNKNSQIPILITKVSTVLIILLGIYMTLDPILNPSNHLPKGDSLSQGTFSGELF